MDALLGAYRKENPELAPLSHTTVVRILNQEGIRPHRMRVWLHSPDPLFREKVTEICSLYLNPPPGAVVLCIDEKTGMQALSRKHPTREPAPGREGREDFEYKRHGAITLLAAFNPHSGEVFGETPPNHKAPTLVAFMESVAERWPEGEVHVVWDNLNTHLDGPDKRWTKFNERHDNRFHFHYTPIHASWVNQVENFFSILDRRVWRYWAHRSKRNSRPGSWASLNTGTTKSATHGDSLLLFSGEGDQRWSHARLTALGRSAWGLSLGKRQTWSRPPSPHAARGFSLTKSSRSARAGLRRTRRRRPARAARRRTLH